MTDNTYTYYCKFDNLEIITKGKKEFYVEGYISTTDKDLADEVLSMSAQHDILEQTMNRSIKFDTEHEIWYDKDGNENSKPTNNLPIGKIISSEIKGNGVWVKAELNQDNPRFKNIWESIKKGFLNAFSVSFYPVEAIKRKVNDLTESVVNRLNLINVALTGNPCNPSATFTPVMKSAINGFMNSFDTNQNNKEDDNMSDKEVDNKTEEVQETEAKEPVKVEEPVKTEEPVAKEKVEVTSDKHVDGTTKEVELKNIASLKADIDALKAEVKALKEENAEKEKKLNQPINKSIVEKDTVNKTKESEYNTFDYIK